MAKKSLPTIEMLHKLFVCDAEAGRLWWRKRLPDMFMNGRGRYTQERNCKVWNAKYAYTEAFTTFRNGYFVGEILGVKLRAHRIIWAMHHGKWPNDEIDHSNHVRADNRIANLSIASRAQNSKNLSKNKNNKSGHMGVHWITNRWRAQISKNGKTKYIGVYQCITAAIFARKLSEIELGFNQNHGKHMKGGNL